MPKNSSIVLIVLLLMLKYVPLSAQWVRTNGPYGGNISCITVSGNNFYAGTKENGIYFSSNNGESWGAINNGLTNKKIYSIVVSNTNLITLTFDGIFLSTNNGGYWNAINNGLPTGLRSVFSIAASGSNLIAGTSINGVYIATNNGVNWIPSGLKSGGINSLYANGNNVYAGVGSILYLSTDSGVSWNPISNSFGSGGGPDVPLYVSSIAVAGNKICVGITFYGVVLSTNNGASWKRIIKGLPDGTEILSLVANGPDIYAGTNGGGVFKLNDDDSTWTAISYNKMNNKINSLAISGKNILAGNEGGVYQLDNNGLLWNSKCDGITNTYVTTIVSIDKNLFAGTYGNGVFLSTNDGSTWKSTNNGLANFNVNHLFVDGSNIFAGTNGGVFLSTNNGDIWSPLNNGITDGSIRSFARIGNSLFAGGSIYIYRSTDYGNNWVKVGNYFQGSLSLAVIDSILFSASGNELKQSTDLGQNWNEIIMRIYNGTGINSLVTVNKDLYAGSGGSGIFRRSYKDGEWGPFSSGLEDSSEISSFTEDNSIIFTGMRNGEIYYTSDSKVVWTKVNDGLLNTPVYSLAGYDKNLFAGTYDSGVWRRPLSEMITDVDDRNNNLPARFVLYQNYPNPFNPSTTINYSIASLGHVSIKVYDLLGREVATLLNEEKLAGNYTCKFNGINMPSGVYFYRMQVYPEQGRRAGNFTSTKKLVLLK